jgi:hypothetical protein
MSQFPITDTVRYLAVSEEVRGYRSIAPSQAGDNECDRAREKRMMVFRQFTKFVVDLNPGHCSLGAQGSNVYRVEATLRSFSFRSSWK